MEMINPSNEQLSILRQIKHSNCVVDSVAGCGKTKTVIFTAMAYRNDSILVLMYNKDQRMETRKILKLYRLDNVDVHTYHSAAYNLYSPDCMRDNDIQRIIDENKPKINYTTYDMIIIDESQDFNNLYYKFVCKIIRDYTQPQPGDVDQPGEVDAPTKYNDKVDSQMAKYGEIANRKCRLVVLGDFMQEVYVFNNSNTDYILNPERYFPFEWSHLQLTKTFRLTKPMVELVNSVNEYFIGNTRMLVSDKDSNIRPKYYVCDTEFIYGVLKKYLDSGRKPHEIFILTPSINKNYQVTKLCNILTNNNIPIYIRGDTSSRNSARDVANGKLVISTIHAIKGGERPIVLLMGFDDSVLPKMLNKNSVNKSAIIYVALTRAKEELVIFHHYSNAFIIPPEIVKRHCDFSIEVSDFAHNHLSTKGISVKENYCVTDMVKYLSHDLIAKCKEYIIVTTEIAASENIATQYGIPHCVQSIVADSYEEIADINGFLIPAFHSQFCFNFKSLIEYFEGQYRNTPFQRLVKGYVDELNELCDDLLFNTEIDMARLTRAATIYNGLCNRLFFKIEQIKDFNWMNIEFLNECSDRLSTHLSVNTQYEIPVSRLCINGIIDAIDNDIVYELKCTSIIEDEHLLQLALYSFLMPNKTYKLFNIYTGELLSLVITNSTAIAEILMKR